MRQTNIVKIKYGVQSYDLKRKFYEDRRKREYTEGPRKVNRPAPTASAG